jgi:hypothetical protein
MPLRCPVCPSSAHTARTVRIRDRRLGIPYYVFLALILVYNIVIIFFEVGAEFVSH